MAFVVHFSPFDGRQVSSPNPKKKPCLNSATFSEKKNPGATLQRLNSRLQGKTHGTFVESSQRGMNPVAMTIINPRKEYLGSNQRPPVLKSCALLTELWGSTAEFIISQIYTVSYGENFLAKRSTIVENTIGGVY